jgi:hypothetical protein
VKQKLVIEIDTAHDYIEGGQSPAVADLLRGLADHFMLSGVQLTKYPCSETPEGYTSPFYRMDLIESGDVETWEPCLVDEPREPAEMMDSDLMRIAVDAAQRTLDLLNDPLLVHDKYTSVNTVVLKAICKALLEASK